MSQGASSPIALQYWKQLGVHAPVKLHVVEGADHSFNILKALDRSQPEVQHEIIQVVGDWLASRDEF